MLGCALGWAWAWSWAWLGSCFQSGSHLVVSIIFALFIFWADLCVCLAIGIKAATTKICLKLATKKKTEKKKTK